MHSPPASDRAPTAHPLFSPSCHPRPEPAPSPAAPAPSAPATARPPASPKTKGKHSGSGNALKHVCNQPVHAFNGLLQCGASSCTTSTTTPSATRTPEARPYTSSWNRLNISRSPGAPLLPTHLHELKDGATSPSTPASPSAASPSSSAPLVLLLLLCCSAPAAAAPACASNSNTWMGR